MVRGININVKSTLGLLAVIAFLTLVVGIGHRYYYPNSEIPDSIFIGAATVLGLIISIGIYAITDLGLLFSFILGYAPVFIMLGFITPVGWMLLLLDIIALFIVIIIAFYSDKH